MSESLDGAGSEGLAPDVKWALGPALLGFLALVLLAVINVFFRGDGDESTPTVVAVLLFILGVVAFGTMVAAGFRAASALRSGSMVSGAGRFAVRLAVVLAVVLAAMALILGLLAKTGTWEQDSEPFLGVWVLLALVAAVIGAFSPEPGRRGLLILPFLIGVAALVLFLSEVTGVT